MSYSLGSGLAGAAEEVRHEICVMVRRAGHLAVEDHASPRWHLSTSNPRWARTAVLPGATARETCAQSEYGRSLSSVCSYLSNHDSTRRWSDARDLRRGASVETSINAERSNAT